MHPYYIARTFGGLLFLLGAIVGSYNVLMTIRHGARSDSGAEADSERPADPAAATASLQPGE